MHASLRLIISATTLSLLVHLSLLLQQSYGPTDSARCSATFFIISSRGHFEYQLIPRNRLPHWYSFAVPHHPNLTAVWDSPRHRHTFSVPPRPMTPMIVDTSSTKVPPPSVRRYSIVKRVLALLPLLLFLLLLNLVNVLFRRRFAGSSSHHVVSWFLDTGMLALPSGT